MISKAYYNYDCYMLSVNQVKCPMCRRIFTAPIQVSGVSIQGVGMPCKCPNGHLCDMIKDAY